MGLIYTAVSWFYARRTDQHFQNFVPTFSVIGVPYHPPYIANQGILFVSVLDFVGFVEFDLETRVLAIFPKLIDSDMLNFRSELAGHY